MSLSAKELAKKLGISAATVSMVLNEKPGISEETRKSVLQAAQKYDCRLPQKKSEKAHKFKIQFIIFKHHGTIVTDTPFFAQVTEGIDLACKQLGCQFLITYFSMNQDIEKQLKELEAEHWDGLLLLGTEMEASYFSFFESLNIPMVVLDTYFEQITCDTVLINNVQGAFLATNFLIKKGMQTVGYLHSSYDIGNFQERADGYYKALRHHKLETSHPYVHHLTPSLEGAYADMQRFLSKKPQVAEGYFADNDFIAAGAMRAFREAGYKIPEDISFIGFDDMPVCDFLDPPLTTMTVPKQKLGELAVLRLYEKIQKPDMPTTKLELSTNLHLRKSVRE